MDETQIRQIVQDEIKTWSQEAQYTVSPVPVHTHNNIDSPNLPQHSITGFENLPSVVDTASGVDGVASPTLLNGQALVFGDVAVATPYTQFSANITIYPLPIVYGYGTSSTANTTAVVAAGAVSATLTAPWGGTTALLAVQFDSGEVRNVQFTNGSASITWTPKTLSSTVGVVIDIIANSRFHGGEAPYGTALIFRNDDDGINQLWVRTQAGSTLYTWAGVDLGGTGLYIYS